MKDFSAANDNAIGPVVKADAYEKCFTCTKDGNQIRSLHPRPDYLSQDFRTAVGALLNQFGLPYPKKSQVFRGTAHDMIFLQQGLVTRIGPLHHANILHPAVLQPLIHANDNDIDEELTITISPGIRFGNACTETKAFKKFLEDTKHNTEDAEHPNIGITDNEVTVLLDIDDRHSQTECKKIRGQKKKRLRHHMRDGTPWYIAARKTMKDVYGDHKDFQHYIRAYDYHQPLRAEIYAAASASHPDDRRQKLSDFYNRCSGLVKKLDENGIALYRPWTKKPIDNARKERKGCVNLPHIPSPLGKGCPR